ncbi:MAG: adenylate/guanylate cyclase domain-containing protein [bacterium]
MRRQLIAPLLRESIGINEDKPVHKTIVFSDIVKSSSKWRDNPKEMIEVIENFTSVVDAKLNIYDGLTIKTIGDAFMFAFDSLKEAIHFAIDIQEYLLENPYEISGEKLLLRIGICAGDVYEATSVIQNENLKDYLGNTVNTASRIESKVCEEGDVAFTYLHEDEIDKEDIDTIIGEYETEVVSFTNDGNEIKRSGRLLTNIQRHKYEDVDELKGIDEIDVYKIQM